MGVPKREDLEWNDDNRRKLCQQPDDDDNRSDASETEGGSKGVVTVGRSGRSTMNDRCAFYHTEREFSKERSLRLPLQIRQHKQPVSYRFALICYQGISYLCQFARVVSQQLKEGAIILFILRL